MQNSELNLKPLFMEDYYSDLVVLTDGKLRTEDGCTFNIHKIELAKNSNYFYRLFCSDLSKDKEEFLIPGIRGAVLSSILSYIYTGSIQITEENVCELLVAADYLLIDAIVKHIQNNYMRSSLSISNCLSLFTAALQINRQDILRESFRFIQTHFETVVAVKDSKLGELPLVALEQFLGNKNLRVRDENTVWMAIAKWVQTDMLQRQWLVPKLLTYLTVSGIDEELASIIFEHDVVASNLFCVDIVQLRQSSLSESNLDVLRNYILQREKTGVASWDRSPDNLYFVGHYCVHNQTDGVHIYVTYDENIDLWRKIVEIDVCPEFIVSIGFNIYMFATLSTTGNKNFCFKLIEKEWSVIRDLRVPRNYYGLVQLEGLIYVLGGISVDSEEEIYDVEAYNPVEDAWYEVSPMMPVTSFNSATLGERIYVVGNSLSSDLEMVMQAYDKESDAWIALASPCIFRYSFALVEHRDRLFVIGGRNEVEYLKSIEVFDPATEEWTSYEDLPYIYYLPNAIVLNNELIVYDNHLEDRSYLKTNPAVQWNEGLLYWKQFEESSPMNACHKFCFFTPDDRECVNWISRENKHPATEFLKSPFN